MIAVGADELGEEVHTDTKAKCPNCRKNHEIEYGTDAKTGEVSNVLGFVKCSKNKKVYLVTIQGKLMK